MDSVLVESLIPAKSPSFGLVFSPNYDSMLKESIDRFLTSVHSQTLDFSTFRSIFSRLLQSTADPPLEIVLFFCAINYHESISSAVSPIDRVLAIKDLVQFLAACSPSCSGLKSIAFLAPVVSELYGCLLEEGKVSGKGAKKLRREVEGLVEGVLSYISICSGKSDEGEYLGAKLLPCFLDLVRVWTVGRAGGGSGLEVLFPLVSEEVRGRFKEEGCGVGYLAGVVIVEVFLLKLSLKVRADGALREDLHKEFKVWAVSSVTVFQNRVFYEILLRLLLDPTLPVISLLEEKSSALFEFKIQNVLYAAVHYSCTWLFNIMMCLQDSKDEILVRDILYDVVILVDYSFLNSGMDEDQSYDFMRCLAVRRLMVTHDAIRIAREKGDHGKAISYMSAFSTSCLPNQIVKWVANQSGIEKSRRPDVNTPQLVLEWLVSLEDQGMRVFEDSMSKLRAKLMFDKSKAVSKVSAPTTESKERDADIFFIDNRGHAAADEEMQSVDDTAFLAAARSMKSLGSNGRKRKEVGDKEETPVKFLKYRVNDSSMNDYLSTTGDVLSSGSEVDNPPSDDEMEEN